MVSVRRRRDGVWVTECGDDARAVVPTLRSGELVAGNSWTILRGPLRTFWFEREGPVGTELTLPMAEEVAACVDVAAMCAYLDALHVEWRQYAVRVADEDPERFRSGRHPLFARKCRDRR